MMPHSMFEKYFSDAMRQIKAISKKIQVIDASIATLDISTSYSGDASTLVEIVTSRIDSNLVQQKRNMKKFNQHGIEMA